jgi:hypothetical protein
MWRDDARLLDMLLAARELNKYAEGVTLEEKDRYAPLGVSHDAKPEVARKAYRHLL